ncbi:MAG TPA: hypothetical protein VFJ83_01105 [Nocardioidaceae bacterium]|nr:hypothetical protein [Nocardioidaceae bacterium]
MESPEPLPRVHAESIGKCRSRAVEYLEGLRCATDVTQSADQCLGQFLLERVTVEGRRQRLDRFLPPTTIHQCRNPVEQDPAMETEKFVNGGTVKGFPG